MSEYKCCRYLVPERQNISLPSVEAKYTLKLIPPSSNQNSGKIGISVGGRLLTAEPF